MKNKASVIIWFVAIISILTVAYIFYNKNARSNGLKTESPAQLTDNTKQIAPDFKLKDLNGKNVKLSDYRGKIVILNFWAVWCKYCVQEMPDLHELNLELQKENEVVILAVNVQETKDKIQSFLAANKVDLNVLLDSDGAVSTQYGISGLPTTLIIDKNGTVLDYIPGKTDKATLQGKLAKIKNGEPLN